MDSSVTSHLLSDESELTHLRALLKRVPRPGVVDFEEHMAVPAIRAMTRLWQTGDELIAFAYVDAFNNLWFEFLPEQQSDQLEFEIIEWGVTCMRQRHAGAEELPTLDATCNADNAARVEILERHGFVREAVRTLKYERSLTGPVPDAPLPAGFSLRSTAGEREVDALAALHRAAFGTDNMTAEARLAIIHAPNYIPELDLLAVAPDRDLAAFCICGFEEEQTKIGYTDPIGVHPRYRRLGLGKAIVTAGLRAIRDKGATAARLGTSSENMPMQKLAEELSFVCMAEHVWFSKVIPAKEH